MNYQRFLSGLPDLYDDWGGPSARPSTSRFGPVLARVHGMTSAGVLQLLNHAVACLEAGEAYGEVGCFQGATLIGALQGHACPAFAADNFSEFDPQGVNHARLLANLTAFGLRHQVHFADTDFEPFLAGLRGSGARLGVYFYDGAHDYRSQLLGLLLAVPLLAERALLVIDDSNTAAVRQATGDFLAVHPECRLLLDLPTPGNEHPSFWNGLHVLCWDAARREPYSWGALRRFRQPALLESLHALQQVNLRVQGATIRMTPAG